MSATLIHVTEEGLEQTWKQAGINHRPGSAPVALQVRAEYVPAGTGPSFKSPFDQVTFLLTGEQTGGAFFMAEVTVQPGSGNPLHIHDREDETFYLQQGTLTVRVGDKAQNALPGDLIHLPRGIAHCFQNNGDMDAKFLCLITPAGFEKFFEEGFYPAADWPDAMPPVSEEFMGRVLAAAAKCGLTFVPPA